MRTVGILGCGYVGLSLAGGAARAGHEVVGVDVDSERIAWLTAGQSPSRDVGLADDELQDLLALGTLRFQSKLETSPDVIVICVPTPLREGQPDMTHIEAAGHMASSHLREGTLVVLESTTYPGTTEEFLRPILEEGSGLIAGRDFRLAHSPERIDPGNTEYGLENTPKVVGGLTPACTAAVVEFYSSFVEKVLAVSSPRSAEMSKLLENSFRHVNIALANETAIVCHELGIDPWEVIDAAATKPFGFVPFFPGPGVGGHCIGIDPQYLAWRVRGAFGHQFRMLELAQDINERMPAHVAQRSAEILNEHGKALRGARVLLLGMAYKKGSSDIRESPSLRVAARLQRMGAEVVYHDPHVPSVVVDNVRRDSIGLSDTLAGLFDLIIILTDHADVDYASLVRAGRLIYDTRNATASVSAAHVYRS